MAVVPKIGSEKCSFRNTYARHDSNVIEEEIEYTFEITSSLIKHLVRLSAGGGSAT